MEKKRREERESNSLTSEREAKIKGCDLMVEKIGGLDLKRLMAAAAVLVRRRVDLRRRR